ncbi:hypothetical protein IJ090_02410 [Candidatus Saccharibacteria bacterium]|nr:hypothetical protein [Candidatus Saccharibacteria bacterium]
MSQTTKTKSGLATLYLVAFTTLLLGITTLSFSRIMITESREATDSDLSQSAYDSSLAGIEDAKIALLKYHECISENYISTSAGECGRIINEMEQGIKNGSCDVVSRVLNRESAGEVVIQETYDGNVDNDDESFNMNQAYTCVKITEETPDYRSTLTANSRMRVIPVRSVDFAKVAGIQLQWHSSSTADGSVETMYDTIAGDADVLEFTTKDEARKDAPIITFDLFQTDTDFSIYELDLNNERNTGTDHALIMLYPNSTTITNNNYGTMVSASDLLAASSKSNELALNTTEAGDSLTPKPVTCGYTEGYHCRALIEFPSTYRNTSGNVSYAGSGMTRAESTFFLRVTLPYGVPETDFSITLCTAISNNNCTATTFTGVQAVVDSTGRASTLYRRVLSRIELVDLNYPYPEFAIQLNGDDDALIEKNFWVTRNCWRSDGNGGYTVCPNNGDAS